MPERELQHTEHGGVRLAVGMHRGEVLDAFAARAHREFSDATRRVDAAVGPHRGEAFVVVLLAVEHDFGARGIQQIPDRFVIRIDGPAGRVRRQKQRHVPHRDGAGRCIRLQVGGQPAHLIGVDGVAAPVVEHDDVPGSTVKVVAVVAFVPRSDVIAKVVERALRGAGLVFVIAQRGVGA